MFTFKLQVFSDFFKTLEATELEEIKKVTIIGDSIVNNMNYSILDTLKAEVYFPGEEGGNRCYGSKYNPIHKYSKNNYKDVTPIILENKKTDILVIQGSTVFRLLDKVRALRKVYRDGRNSDEETHKEASDEEEEF